MTEDDKIVEAMAREMYYSAMNPLAADYEQEAIDVRVKLDFMARAAIRVMRRMGERK